MYTKIIYTIVILLTIFSILRWSEKNDKAADAYWTSKLTECRSRGANFDLYGRNCVQINYE